jgi:tungstate transport system ATP-binding protein
MTAPPVYELDAVRRVNSDTFALEIDRLTVLPGETLCLVGPTGAGKSTLLRLLSGLDLPTSGRLTLQGQSVEGGNASLETLRRVATVHQRPLLLSESVRYNVEYGLRVRGPRFDRKRSSSILETLGLSQLADQDARTLSGGQVQLVALARALLVQPEVLLSDEPTSHLDPAKVALVENLVREQKEWLGKTVVWATHNLFQARRMASRVGLLLSGRLIEVAETERFFDSPNDERTRDFVQGKMVY